MTILVTDGRWEKGTWAWWPPSAATIKPSWRLWCTLCSTSMWLTGAKSGGGEEVHQLTQSFMRVFGLLYLDVTTLSGGTLSSQFPLDWLHLWRLLLYSSPRWSCLWRRERRSRMYILLPRDLGTAVKNSTRCQTLYSSQFPWYLPIPIEKRGSQIEERSDFTWPYNGWKASTM